MRRPPVLAQALVELVVPEAMREVLLGDLEEEFRELSRDPAGVRSARRWYWRQAIAFCRWRRVRPARVAAPNTRRRPRGRPRWVVSDVADAIWHDVAVAARRLRRAPGSSAVIVTTFALGIGSNVTMFGVIDRLLLSAPDHVTDPDRVVRLFQRSESLSGVEFRQAMAYPDLADLEGASSFVATAGLAGGNPLVGSGETAQRVRSQWATASLFPLLGVQPALGRFFSPEDDRPRAGGTAVLSWGLWQGRYGADPEIIGRRERIGAQDHTIIGVAPRGFTGPTRERVDVWLPFHPTATNQSGQGWETARAWNWIQIIGRLAPGVSRDAAQAQVNALKPDGWGAASPGRRRSLVIASLLPTDEPRTPTWASISLWLAGISVLVWVIAAANVANLLLAREFGRRRETAVRLALGVSRARLLRHYFAEALLPAGLAAVAAVIVASWGVQVIQGVLLPDLPPLSPVRGSRVIAATLLTCLVTAGVAAFVPAARARHRDLAEDLKARNRIGHLRTRLQGGLVILQGAFSVVLLVMAGLFVRSLAGVESLTHVGVEAESAALLQIFFDSDDGDPGATTRLYAEARDRIRRLPWVAYAAASTFAPFSGSRGVQIRVPGRGELTPGHALDTSGPDQVHITSEFFESLAVPIRRGRGIAPADELPGSARIAVISQSMADHYWPGRDPIGECLWIEGEETCTTIVGVSGDVRWDGLESPASLIVYLPLGQRANTPRFLIARVDGSPSDHFASLRREVRAASSQIRFVGVQGLASVVGRQAGPWRLGARLCALFGTLALLVAGLGLYSLLAFRVAQGRHEIAVRGALGASRPRITAWILRDGLRLAGAGMAAGLLIASIASRWVEPLLIEISARDPVVYSAVVATLGLAALLASLVPARRATRVAPAEALKAD